MAIELPVDNVELHEIKSRQLSTKTSIATVAHAASYPVLSNKRATLLVCSMSLAMVLNVQSVQGITVALERIGESLEIKIVNYQWLTSAYSLAFGSTLLLFGRLADIYGHRRLFLVALGWFIAWSIASGFAPNEISMDIFRAMQGIGMGAAIPSALGILGTSFPPGQAKSWAFATFSAGAPLGGSVGAVFSGVLTQYAEIEWRAWFHVTAGIAALVLIGAFVSVPADTHRDSTLTVDWIGALLITAGLCLSTFALADGPGQPQGWRTPYIPVLFVVGVLLIAGFWFWERYLEKAANAGVGRQPLMRPSLWFKGRFAIVQLIAALGWCSFSSTFFFITLWFQDLQELDPLGVTVRFLPAPATGIILCIIVGLLASRVAGNWLIAVGCLGTGLAPLLFALQGIEAPYWQWQFPGMILSVLGADFIFAVGIMYCSKVAGNEHQALAGGVFNMMTQIGTSIGLAICTIIQSRVTQDKVEAEGQVYSPNVRASPAATEAGLRAAFYGCSGFALLGFVIALTALYGIGKVGTRTKAIDLGLADESGVSPSSPKNPYRDSDSETEP